jgi:hypothetical protein
MSYPVVTRLGSLAAAIAATAAATTTAGARPIASTLNGLAVTRQATLMNKVNAVVTTHTLWGN